VAYVAYISKKLVVRAGCPVRGYCPPLRYAREYL